LSSSRIGIKGRVDQGWDSPASKEVQSLAVRWAFIYLVLLYRATLGRVLGGHCRYHPTCSQYALDAINKYGAWRGGWRAIKRIARCHPWGGRGYDPA
jgi:uncharacterized protein